MPRPMIFDGTSETALEHWKGAKSIPLSWKGLDVWLPGPRAKSKRVLLGRD